MNIIMMRRLMRQQSRTTTHEHYRIKLWRGGRGLAILNFFNTPHRFSLPKFFIKTTL